MKPLEEIVDSLSGFRKVLIIGCGSCVTVCLSGGDREARQLALELSRSSAFAGSPPVFAVDTIIRQCERDLVSAYQALPEGTEAILSLACGCGVQTLGDVFEPLPVIPALNTTFYGASNEAGVWQEVCQGCGDCVLSLHRRHLSRGPMCQEPVQRAVRRLPKRELRDLCRCSLRLGVDLLPLEKAKQTPPAPHGPSASGLAAGRRRRSAGATAYRYRRRPRTEQFRIIRLSPV